jgi:long-chain acyl-CoA synthetase
MRLNLSHYRCLGEAIREEGVPRKSALALIEIDRDREIGRWSHREVHREAERVAALLQDLDFRPSDRCALLMSNQSKWVFSALGAFWAGGILVPLDYKLTARQQADLLAHNHPKILILEWPIWERFQREKIALPSTIRIVVTEAPLDTDFQEAYRWESSPRGSFQYRGGVRSDVATIIYSSGTGGRTKGCQLTHEGFLRQIEQLYGVVKPTEEDRYFSILPSNHAIDFMCGFFMPLLCGSSVVYQRSLRSQYLVATMRRYHVTLLALVPLLLKMLKAGIEEKIEALPSWKKNIFSGLKSLNEAITLKKPLPQLSRLLLKPLHEALGGHLRQIIAGGAYVDRTVAEFFNAIGIPVAIGYGLTEAGTAITLNDLKPFRGDTVGKPLPGMELEIREPDGEGVGEVWVKGPSVMKGYLDDPDLSSEVLMEGWLRTGDLGRIDASGHLKLWGRAKNMIVTEGGKNVYPEDIENAFEGLEGCEEFCVFAANYLWPERSLTGEKLVLVLRPKAKKVDEKVLEDLRRRNRSLADFKRLTGYVEWNQEFTRTSSMKIKRQVLAQEIRTALRREEALQSL